ncbi:MAG TPA: hypothetical protein VFT50_14125 [Baekduia sp.]|nr:hypothetical protein [Baekduia sp.]
MTSTDLHDCFRYEDCDVPPGQSLSSWRHEREQAAQPGPRHLLLRLLRLLG